MPRLDWNALQHLLALARGGSLDRAAEALRVDPSTVSRRVRALEEAVGARLFDRTARGHQLTSVGKRLFDSAERVEGEVGAMEREAAHADHRLAGTVTIATSDAVGRHLLSPVLARFRDRHPLVDFQVVADVRPANVVRREADMALRLSRPRQALLASRRLAVLGHGLYGARHYLERHPFRGAGALEEHVLLGYDAGLAGIPEARWLDERGGGARWALRANRVDLMLEAVAHGMGLAVLPCYAAAGDPRLVCLLGAAEVVRRELWLVLHRDSRRTARIRAFADFLAAELGRMKDLLEGEASVAGTPG
ncbi:MAG: LysR family transcriptional regulator [Deltaproteobacteria bacterium]|nr:LysR family transcriptional regulator [Deltaproteobacteria bacterium]